MLGSSNSAGRSMRITVGVDLRHSPLPLNDTGQVRTPAFSSVFVMYSKSTSKKYVPAFVGAYSNTSGVTVRKSIRFLNLPYGMVVITISPTTFI